jgi:hypothetical protein
MEMVAKENRKGVQGTEWHGTFCTSLRTFSTTCPFDNFEINAMLVSFVAVLCLAMFLTLGPTFSTAILMAVFVARHSLQSAAWVYANDPRPDRGRICAMFHVSVGIWLGAPSALLTIGIIVFSHNYLQVPLDMARANRTLLSLFSAIGISAIMGGVASLMALWKGVRVWVNPHFCRAFAEQQTGRHIRSNYGLFVTATSITIPALGVLAVVLMNEVPPAIGAAVVPGTILVVLIPLFWLSSRIFAASPTGYLQSHIRCDTSKGDGERSSSQTQ